MSKPTYKRRKRIIKPRLQWKLIGSFIGILVLGMLLQYLLLAQQLTELAGKLPSDATVLTAETPSLLATVLMVSFLILLPATVIVGVTLTFRIAGPIYRFEQHLGAIIRGEKPGTCYIRNGDELVELCALINEAVETLEGDAADEAEQAGDEDRHNPANLRRVG